MPERRVWCSAVLFFFAAAASCSRGPAAGPIRIEALPGAAPSNNAIRVIGLSGAELRELSRTKLDTDRWQALFRVAVSENESTAVAGRYDVGEEALEFHPTFPFDLGRSYAVRFDPKQLPTPRPAEPVSARIRFSGPVRSPSASVAALYPSGPVWPENMLRFYLHFSKPMSRSSGVKYIHLMDDGGKEVPDAILAAYADLWNDDATRLTVFFDPGRVKRGVGPNVALGRAIVEGRRYAIAVDAAWPDGDGQPLTAPFRREFTAGPPAYKALSLKDWHITTPKAGTTQPVAAVFPAALDHALLLRAIGVRTPDGEDVPGTVATGAHETAWTFTPSTAWKAGAYQLAVLTLLEDPAGNKIGQPFEILPDTPQPPKQPEIETLTFEVR